MCGIAAIIGNKNSRPESIEIMLEAIRSRGEGRYFNESTVFSGAVLGMNRLAIVDREQALQPMLDQGGRFAVAVIFNGEIYNFKSLKVELEALGYGFKTDSDTEVLANGYAAWGMALVDKIKGIFAFVIYDTKEGGFFAARDHFGIKPLYYSVVEGEYLLASEIKSLSQLEEVKSVELFPPHSYMLDGELHSYWEIPKKLDDSLSEVEAVSTLRTLFDEAVKSQVQTDLPIAVYLSGGVDSTAVLATARKYHPDVTAVILGNEDSSDRVVALRYCKEYGVPYVLAVPPTEKELVNLLPEIVRLTESFEPNMIRQSAVSYFIAKCAAEAGFKVILCGEGADELFAGYPEFSKGGDVDLLIRAFLKDLHRTQLQRVDRTSMAFTTEVRVPFLDIDFAEYALKIPARLKVIQLEDHTVTKYIFRKAMEDRLPEYIYNRAKVVLSEGAGFKGNQRVGGLFYEVVCEKISDGQLFAMQREYPQWHIATKEEAWYFNLYTQNGYIKADFNRNRTAVNGTNTVNPVQVLKQFNTWSFKREQPHDLEGMLAVVAKAIKENTPVPFVLYWGKGDREVVSSHERQCLEYLEEIDRRIKQMYAPGAQFKLILTDTHAGLNGYAQPAIDSYFKSVERLAGTFENITTQFLSALAPLDIEVLKKAVVQRGAMVEVMKSLVDSAEKHFKSSGDYQEGARLYFAQNQLEKKAMEDSFPDSIFLTFNGGALNPIFPTKLPIFYSYSMKKGDSRKPWFLSDDLNRK